MNNQHEIKVKIKTSPKDFFLNLLSIVALYTSATSFTVAVFQYINLAFPDILEGGQSYWAAQSARTAIRFALSSLIVVFPVYVWVNWFLNKSYAKEPEKRKLRIRRWLIYFTLFAAALIIIGDLVALVNKLLGGEFTIRFILKVLTVFFVAGSVFYYYLSDLRKHKTE